jgi:hypothetical protein
MSIRLPGGNPLASNYGLSPLESQLVKRNLGGSMEKFGNGNLTTPMPKLRTPVARPHRMTMPHIRMPLQPKTSF